MNKILIVLIIGLFINAGIFAQTNPFEEYGYDNFRLLTLSDGKYNEFFDNDTVVQIGSVLFNTKTRKLTAFVEVDTIYSEATLEPEVISRWMCPDPLAEKYAEWSPYNYVMNNPILFIDPNGMYVDNYELYSNGNIVKYETNDNTNNYVYIDNDGNRHDVGTYSKNDNGLIQLGDVNYESGNTTVQITAKPGNESELYISGDGLASLIGASADSGEEIYVTRVSNSDGSSPGSSQSHKDGNNLDTRYAQNDGSRASLDYEGSLTEFNKIDQTASAKMNAGIDKYGWKDIRSSTLSVTSTFSVKGAEIPITTNHSVSGTNHMKKHFNHQHCQGYNPKVVTRMQAPTPLTPIQATRL